ncbi:hypothetical protein HLK59_04525 [Streptomyces sp. S3(2020)]|uniref:DUF6493 family protein n=1 Tax=Streptomyces sp. S3(2020) TaxID=2732044 RepID=UPI0014877B04|nr:DUF6493 family protein [Streptomyces sp. S3(2020)]NNN29632.1 hypothetical protein [Streptomyces sp. S3(2020)]
MTLVQLAEAGDVSGVLRELGTLTPDERAAQAEALEARRAPMGADWRHVPEKERAAQLAAELGCRTDPVAAADWILRPGYGANPLFLPLHGVWMLDVVNLHPVAWRAELAAQLGERSTHVPGMIFRSDLVEHLVHDTGCPVPTSDGFISSWLSWRGNDWGPPAHLCGRPRPDATFLERLRTDDLSPMLLPLALERPGVLLGADSFHEFLTTRGRSYIREETRLGVFISLAEEGLVDRAALIRRVFTDLARSKSEWNSPVALTELALTPAEHALLTCERVALALPLLARLLQDGTRRETATPLAYLRALDLTQAENVLALRDHVALLDRSSPVASYAQEVLTGLDEAGLLEPDVFTETCERVLLRPEKKLARAQLVRLDRAARKDPARAARTVLDAATALGHRDVDVQERALDVIARHLEAAGDPVLPELRTAAARISPGLMARAADLFGTAADRRTDQLVRQYADMLPVVPEPRPVPGPIETAVEVAEELAAVVANDKDVVTFERVLDGLVRHAHLDRAALVQALRPVMREEPREVVDFTQSDVYDVARALRGDQPRKCLTARIWRNDSSPAGDLLRARLAEAIDIIDSDAQPFLLSVPTDATGALDAAVLVRRLAVLDGLGITPAPVDLAQALLRVTPTADETTLGAAGQLGSDAGQRLARWLREGGLPHRDSGHAGWPDTHAGKHPTEWLSHLPPGPTPGPALLPSAATLIGPHRDSGLYDPMVPFWLAQLPHHRELVLARDYFRYHVSRRGWAHALPFAAESGGPAGFALHLALADTLTYDQQGERDAAVDALLVLAARGQLDTGLLGRQLAEMLRGKWIEANRVTASLRTAADTGAYATVWSVLETVLPRLLRDPAVRGTGPLLALGVDCASRCAAQGEIPEVTAAAGRAGSSQVVKNARLLREILA